MHSFLSMRASCQAHLIFLDLLILFVYYIYKSTVTRAIALTGVEGAARKLSGTNLETVRFACRTLQEYCPLVEY
jgi:ABC-type xylose transport system permease subunit